LIQLLENFILPETQKAATKDRKVVIVGLTKLLTQTDALLQPDTVSAWSVIAPFEVCLLSRLTSSLTGHKSWKLLST
jgi:hypothetical protein